jgi:hypothetical protein
LRILTVISPIGTQAFVRKAAVWRAMRVKAQELATTPMYTRMSEKRNVSHWI